jgi:uncharacterized protein
MLTIRCLIWDAWNVGHMARHRVTHEEVEEVCHGEPVTDQTYKGHIRVVGPTESRRMLSLILAPTDERGVYYPITARPADRKEHRHYDERRNQYNPFVSPSLPRSRRRPNSGIPTAPRTTKTSSSPSVCALASGSRQGSPSASIRTRSRSCAPWPKSVGSAPRPSFGCGSWHASKSKNPRRAGDPLCAAATPTRGIPTASAATAG